jgi:hypothetical protein
MKSKQTQKTSTKKCSEMECLTVNIYKNHSKAFVYNVWNGKQFIGEIIEDDIMYLLSGNELKRLDAEEVSKFKVSIKQLKRVVVRPNTARFNN